MLINDDMYEPDPEEPDFDAIRASVDADLAARHGDESDDALDAFTRQALRAGQAATLWALTGGLLTALLLTVAVLAAGPWTRAASIALALATGWATRKRWHSARARAADTIERAMTWTSTHQDAQAQARADEAQRAADVERTMTDAALADELTWRVEPVPFITVDDLDEVVAHGKREAEVLLREFRELALPHDAAESRNMPAVRAWIDRWANTKPLVVPPPPRQSPTHSIAEGKRLERELCRATNKHWDGSFHRLLNEGADPNGFNGSGRPLRIAVLRGKVEYMSWLITRGANPNGKCYGRTMLSILMSQVEDYIDEGDGEGDDFCWPEKLELLVRLGANPFLTNDYWDRDDDSEGPTAWPFIVKRPVLYEAYQRGMAARREADNDAHRLLNDVREHAQRIGFADEVEALLGRFRNARPV
ncbi:hypothetical protein DBB29_08605 [Pandoraea cepalis]|uniref:Ankyrin n=1 Tax=Pandoraea cepalis TaxID=2508294 RepID=A0AAW7MLI7_9BURK|nr:hypothetical protein [Pandoraea cepalis]MDN4573633.1 hypothetical protein [Pandoraea cepalis]MDN4578175.1 hypothetical protein [Pandoraea cepalis]